MPTKRQVKVHMRQVLEAYVPGVANRTGLPERGFVLTWADGIETASTNAEAGVIYMSWPWFSEHPDDYGLMVHEYTHLIQNIPGGTCPEDIVEGFADAMRYMFGLFDPSWWYPSSRALQISKLSWFEVRDLSQSMNAGTYNRLALI